METNRDHELLEQLVFDDDLREISFSYIHSFEIYLRFRAVNAERPMGGGGGISVYGGGAAGRFSIGIS